jgi:hypothetical protein
MSSGDSDSGSLPRWVSQIAEKATQPGFERWRQMVEGAGGCTAPIRLVGNSVTIDADTGEVLDTYSTRDEPTEYLLVACGNRRASTHVWFKVSSPWIKPGRHGPDAPPLAPASARSRFAPRARRAAGARHAGLVVDVVVVASGKGRRAYYGAAPPVSSPLRVPIPAGPSAG